MNTFRRKKNCAGTTGFDPLQKVTVAMRTISYESGADTVDEYIGIGESTSLETLH